MKRKLSEKVGVLFLATVLFLSATVVSFGAGDDHSGIEEEDESWNDEIDENLYLSKPIYDWNNLNDVRNDLSSAYLLMNDLTSDTDGYDTWVGTVDGWDPIGDDVAPFTGTFDGNGFTISDLYINRPTEEFVGLFGYIDGAEIKDVELVDVDVTGEQRVGGLVGRNEGLVSNTSSIGSVEGASGYYNGVLIGYNNDNGDVYSSYSSGTVTGSNGLGGLCGLNRGSISNSYSTANVIGTGSYIGGLVGEHRGEITNAYSKGEVSGGSSVGGLVGWSSGTVVDSFWDTDTSGHTWSAGDETGKTTEEMKDIATYTDTTTVGLVTPWDFVDDPNDDVGDEDIWHIHERINYGYPFLTWEPSAIYDWHDLDSIRNDLDGDYILMNDIDENSEGYWDYNNQVEASHEIREDAGYQQTWDDGDTIKIRFDDGDYDSILGVEDDGGNPIAHTVGEDITIDEDTGERYVYVFYENALVGWEPIGEFDSDNLDLAFRGTFDGDGHEIRDLYIHRPGENDVGLFGCILAGSLVENIGITGSTVSGGTRVGTLVGNHRGDVNNSYANGYVSGFFTVGGLVGRSYFRSVTNSYAAGEVTGYRLVGGLVGYNMYADVLNSYSTCTVTADQSLVGGLVGYNDGFSTSNSNIFNSYATGEVTGIVEVGGLVGRSYSNTTVSDCYATGSVTGENNVGGLVGVNTYYQWGDVFEASSILNSYSIGTVSGVQEVGGLIGFNDQSIVYNSFWDTERSGTDTGIGDGDQDGATGKTTAQMNDISTFTDLSTDGLDEPWDFVNNPNDDVGDEEIWNIHESFNDGYPFLTWDPFAIYDWYDLDGIRQNLGGDYMLMNDLDENSAGYDNLVNTAEGWDPIGGENIVFTGTFDGNGQLIKDLYINRPDEDYIGLFGHVEGGNIHNMGIIDADLTGDYFIGTLAGRKNDGSIYEIYATGTLNGDFNVGGLVGSNAHDSSISSSYAHVNVIGDSSRIGGLVGNNWFGTVINSYSTGEVSGVNEVGGLVGFNKDGIVENSFWDMDTSGLADSDGGTGKSTVEMKDVATFTDISTVGLDESWDFLDDPNDDTGGEDTWHIHERINNGYPFFTWERSAIYDWYDLDAVRDDLDGDYILMNDLDENSAGYDVLVDTVEGFEPIGESGNIFTGSLDGNGHEIEDLYINRPANTQVGLFGYVDDVTIEDLKVSGSITGRSWVGGVVGYSLQGSTIINRTVANVDVTNVATTSFDRVGGLVGILHNGNRIYNCAAHGSVSGPEGALMGGLVGSIYNADVIIENSYATGLVNGGDPGDDVGGLVGFKHADAQVIDSYWDALSTGQDVSAGGSPLETNEMTGGRATATGAMEGFDFYDIWYITESYPDLAVHYDINDHLDGQGTEADRYRIETLVGLHSMNYALYANFTLQSDIDASETEIWYDGSGFKPIGDDLNYFSGRFDGSGQSINGIYINRTDYVGLFRGTAGSAEITNVSLLDVDMFGDLVVGGIVGYNLGVVSSSHVSGIITGTHYAGGISAINHGESSVYNSYADVDVRGEYYIGGISGMNDGESSVYKSYAEGDVRGEYYVGGLIGMIKTYHLTVSNSSSSANVTGLSCTGGLIGINLQSTVENSYSIGDIYRAATSTEENFGGFIGLNDQGKIINCYSTGRVDVEDGDPLTENGFVGEENVGGDYEMRNNFWDIESSGQGSTAGNATGKTTEEMQNYETFTNTDTEGLDEPWDIMVVAAPDLEDDYPYLGWEAGNGAVWYIEQMAYAVSFDVSVDDIVAGEQPIVEVYDAVDQFGEPLEGDYFSTIEIGGEFETTSLSFVGGEASYTWEQMVEAGDFTATVTIDGVTESDFFIVNVGEVHTVTISPVDNQTIVTAGEDLPFNAEAFDEYGNLITGDVSDFDWVGAEINGVFNQEVIGDYDVTASYGEVTSDPVTITVEPGDVDYIEIAPSESTITIGDSETYTAFAYDEYGNEIGDVTADTAWDIDANAGGSWTDNVYTSENDGTWTVTGTYEGVADEATLMVIEETGFIPENLELDVGPIQGEPPLTVTIYVSGENTGEEAGSIDVIVDGTVEYTLQIPADSSADHTFTHTFDEVGSYLVEFHDLTKTVTVGDVIEFVPENIVLDVTPTYGEPGLEVTISVSGDNAGELDGEIDVIVDGTVEYTLVIPAEESADHTFTYTFYELGTYQIEFYDSTETVYVIDTKGFAPVDLELDVDPISGEPPLTVTIFVSAENVGDEDGSIDVVVDGTIEYTLNLPSGESAEHTFTHTFDEGGTYEVELSHIIKTVDVAILPPIISIETLEDGIIFDTDSVSIGWICDEGTYSISHYEIRLNNDDWEDIGKVLEYTFEDLDDGEYTVYIRAVDEHGNDAITSLDFIIDTIDEGDDEDPFFMNPMILGLLILIIAVIVGLILFAMKKKSSGTPPETTPAESETPPPPPAQSQQENMYTPENEGSDAIDGGEDFDQNPMDDESKPIDEAEDIDVDPKAKD